MEEEIFLSYLVFRSFFALLSKLILFYEQKRSLLGFCCAMNAFRLQSESPPAAQQGEMQTVDKKGCRIDETPAYMV